jgi:hypothetical protein
VFFLALVLRHLPKDAIDASLTNADPIWIGAPDARPLREPNALFFPS